MGERIEIRLEKMAARGVCLGYDAGKVVFVPFTLPGEKVRAELVEERKSWSRAGLIEVLEPAWERTNPACPHFGPGGCGGCHWQHIEYPAQAVFKRELVREQFRRLGGLDDVPVRSCRVGSGPYGYRNHAQLRLSPAGPGYIAEDGRQVIPIETCPILHPDLGGLLADLDAVKGDAGRIVLRAGIGTGERMIIFEETVPPPGYRPDANASVIVRDQGGSRLMTGRAHLHEQVAGFRFRIAPDGFFQVSTAGAGALVEEVLLRLPRRPLGTVLDLYAGGGLFSMPIAQRAERVIAVESHPPTSEDARLNAASAGLNNIENLSMDVAAFLERGHGPIDVVLLDPPRRGCGPAVAGRIAALEPSHIVYISCDPATLSRDAAALAGHGFRPVDIRPVDLFPQTFHIETVAHFRPFTSAAPENNA